MLLQLVALIYIIASNSRQSAILQAVLTVISVLTALHVLARKDKGAYKLTWTFLILVFPIFGGLFYWLFNKQTSTRGMRDQLERLEAESREAYRLVEDSHDEACRIAPDYVAEIRYLQKFNGFPICRKSSTEYYPTGEAAFEAILEELEKAQKYIFLEYFIIEEGIMWDSVMKILKRKAAQGVEVRLIYDDLGCFLLLPKNYDKIVEQDGIQCRVFNRFRPVLTTLQNNRNHQKILVVDGKVAFTGGINMADEYINKKLRFGHWKDCAIKIEGHATWSFVVMFLEMWAMLGKETLEYEGFFPWREVPCTCSDDGLVQPYSDSPLDYENVSEHVYLRVIEKAQNYLYINTPYLVLDDSIISALILAAKSGVDVRITLPHIPDKKLVHFLSRSYYRDLIRGGVRVFEYTAGFLHSKTFVADDKVGVVGTVNMDFRSLYLHFECSTWLYESKAVMQLKEDYVETLEHCHEVKEKDCVNHFFVRLLQDVLRLFAPLI